jgi:hypothetical protein
VELSNRSRSLVNDSPCRGLVNVPAIISSVLMYYRITSPLSCLSCRKKNLMSTCLVRSLLERPFLMSWMVYRLSWQMMAGFMGYPWLMRTLRTKGIGLAASLSATSSASVEDLVLSFWVEDLVEMVPFPDVMQHPV